MHCFGFNLENPYVWVFLSGAASGMALRWATIQIRKRRREPIPKSRRWANVCIYLSIAVLLIPVCGHLAGWQWLKHIRLWIFFAGSAGFVFLGTRFPRAFGIPLLFCTGVVIAACVYSFTGWYPVERSERTSNSVQVAAFKVLRRTAGAAPDTMRVRLDVEISGEGQHFIDVEGGRLFCVIDIVYMDPVLFFLKQRMAFRFHEFSMDSEILLDTEMQLPLQPKSTINVKSFTQDPLPLLSSSVSVLNIARVRSNAVVPILLQEYRVNLTLHGSLAIKPSFD